MAVDALAWTAVPLGLGLIVLAMLDVFLTVLHVQIESPISNRLNRRCWQLLLAISRRLPATSCEEILGWGAPLMIGGIVMFWSLLYVVGFALLYAPFVHDPAAFAISDVERQSALGDALYFSALSFFTLGYGEIVPLHPIMRLLAVLQGGFGLTTLSLSVTYLLSVYPLISRKIGLAESLNLETGGRSDGVVLAERYLGGERFEALAQRLVGIGDELLRLGQAHGLYPVLYFVRPRAVHHSFVRILAIVQGIVATLRYGLDRDAHWQIVNDPRLLILEEGLLSTLHTLAASSHLTPRAATQADVEAARRDHLALTEELRRWGLAAAAPDDREALEGHVRFRVATEQYIRAYAANSGYDIASVHAPFSRWERNTALVGHAEASEQPADGDAAGGETRGLTRDQDARPAVLSGDHGRSA